MQESNALPPVAHTPAPWRIAPPSAGKNRITAAHGAVVADANNYNTQADANAAHIVRCVNAIGDLSADALDGGWTAAGMCAYARSLEVAMKAALDVLELAPHGDPDPTKAIIKASWLLRDALAKATK